MTLNSDNTPSSTFSSESASTLSAQTSGATGSSSSAAQSQLSQFTVNTSLPNDQTMASVSVLADGGWIVTWQSYQYDATTQTYSNINIYYKRYDKYGNPLSVNDVKVADLSNNTQATQYQLSSVTSLADGGWVIAWQDSKKIHYQRYDKNGEKVGDSGLASPTVFWETAPSITSLTDGGWIISWQSLSQDHSQNEVYFQRFNKDGAKVNNVTRANTYTNLNQEKASVVGLAGGGWVVVWQSQGQDYDGSYGIYYQHYDKNGVAVGGEKHAVLYYPNSQKEPSVASLSDGGWIITWQSNVTQDSRYYDIHFQRYDKNGNAAGSETQANKTTINTQENSSVTGLADGGWIIVWETTITTANGSGSGIYYQRFDSNGQALSQDVLVDQSEDLNSEDSPQVSALPDGGWVITWHKTSGTEGDNIVAQRYDKAGNKVASNYVDADTPVTDISLTNAFIHEGNNGSVVGDILIADTTPGEIFNVTLINGEDDFEAVRNSQGVWQLKTKTNATLNTDQGYEIVTIQVTDSLGRHYNKDFVINISTWHFNVNTNVSQAQTQTSITTLEDGGWIIVWQSDQAPDGSGHAIYYQRYDRYGNKINEEDIKVANVSTGADVTNYHINSVSALDDGGWIITWYDFGQNQNAYYQRYDINGNKVGEAAQVNSSTILGAQEQQQTISVTTLAEGGWVVVWHNDYDNDSNTSAAHDIFFQVFDKEGNKLGEERKANSTISGLQIAPKAVALGDGGWLLSWQYRPVASHIHFQRYDKNGNTVGEETELKITNLIVHNETTALLDGGWIIVWSTSNGGNQEIFFQRYDKYSNAVGHTIKANSETGGTQGEPSASALADGGWIITWTTDKSVNLNIVYGTPGIYYSRYNKDGQLISGGSDVLVYQSQTVGSESSPDVMALADGGWIITWDSAVPNQDQNILAQRYDRYGNKVNQVYTDPDAPVTDISLTNAFIQEGNNGSVVGDILITDETPNEVFDLTLIYGDDLFELSQNSSGWQLKTKSTAAFDFGETYIVTVQVRDSIDRLYNETFVIYLSDPNNSPTKPILSNTAVQENAYGATIGRLTASDPNNDTLAYQVIGSDSSFEAVKATDGSWQLKLKDDVALDYEDTTTVKVTVKVTDPQGYFSEETFTISVTDVNETGSGFTPSKPALDNTSVRENNAGALIGTLSATDPNNDTLTYSVTSGSDIFEVVQTNGISQLKLKAGVSLDYETRSSYDVHVEVSDPDGNANNQTFTISVTNVNEAPSNISLSKTSVSENSQGAIIGTLTGTDPENNELFYTVTTNTNTFETVQINGIWQLKLKDTISLDYETRQSYTVTIRATDTAGNTYDQVVTISVEDVDETGVDVKPSKPTLDNTSVRENNAGALIGTLSATDPNNDTLTYSVTSGSDIFEVVQTNGISQLKLKAGVSLDYETRSSYSVTIQVSDPSGNTNSQTFTVSVTDVNEAPTQPSLSNTRVNENDVGAIVGILSASDPEDSNLTYSVTSGSDIFEVVQTNGISQLKLKAGVSLDYETRSSYSVTIQVSDPSGNTNSQTFTVSVTDVNEAPTQPSLSNTRVNENDVGAIVGILSASDPEDSNLTYTVTTGFDIFEAIQINGVWQLKLKDGVSLDYETRSSYIVTVQVSDPAGKTSSQAFTISVIDVNETAGDVTPSKPVLDNTDVSENSSGALVGTLSATDPNNDTLTYSVTSGADTFEVVQTNGTWQLKLKDTVSFNYETQSSYAVTVQVSDPSGNTNSQTFVISVTNVNEAPSNISLSKTSVSENSQGAIIGTLTGTDPENDGLFYTVTTNTNTFETVQINGIWQLKLKDTISLDYETRQSYTVTLRATDTAGNTYDQVVTISVEDVDETGVEVKPSKPALDNTSVRENNAGALIGALSATDPNNDNLSYRLISGTTNFEILQINDTWYLKLKDGVHLDYEDRSSYVVTVEVYDPDGNTNNNSFSISVIDINETSSGDVIPSKPALDNTSVRENDAGAFIGTLSATDPNNDTLTYSVTSGSDIFEVVQTNGISQLKLKAGVSLDYETRSSYDVRVEVSDPDGNANNQTFTVSVINIYESTDTKPATPTLDNTTIDENRLGAVIGHLSSLDDRGEVFNYTVIDDANLFEAVQENGVWQLKLKSNVTLDYETKSNYTVTLQVNYNDGGLFQETFAVRVLDINEAPSVYVERILLSSINRGDTASRDIAELSAFDPEGGSLNYKVSGRDKYGNNLSSDLINSLFEIVETNNKVVLRFKGSGNSNYSDITRFILSVTAYDQQNNFNALLAAKVTLAVNDNITNTRPERIDVTTSTAGVIINDTVIDILTNNGPSSGDTLVSLKAIDSLGTNHQWSLLNDYQGAFSIDKTTGTITLNTSNLSGGYSIQILLEDIDPGSAGQNYTLTKNLTFYFGDRQYDETGALIIEEDGQPRDDEYVLDPNQPSVNLGAGDDKAYGGYENNYIYLGNGNDQSFDLGGDNYIDAGKDNDRVIMMAGANTINGGDGNDVLLGGWGSDDIKGGAGNDAIAGDLPSPYLEGNDRLAGGAGDDLLMGGEGADVFVFEKNGGHDVVGTFNVQTVWENWSTQNGSIDTSTLSRDLTYHDVLDFSDFGYTDIALLRGKFFLDSNGHLTFSDQNTTVTLIGVSESELSSLNLLY